MNRRTKMPLLRSLEEGSRDVDSYKDGAPTEFFKLVHGPYAR
jgi:hypothetical protein